MNRSNLFKTLTKVSNVGFLTNELSARIWVSLVAWALQECSAPAQLMITRIYHLIGKNGKTFTVLYLKECVRIFQHYLAGSLVHRSLDIQVSIKGGLPNIIPGYFRSQIRDGNLNVIRLTFTILSIYRVLSIPGKLKLSSITDPFKGSEMTLPKSELKRSIRDMFGKVFNPLHNRTGLILSGSAGPNNPSSLFGIFKDVAAWNARPQLKETLFSLSRLIPGAEEFLNVLFQGSESLSDDSFHLGRLTVKEEAAGKVRVFAITDLITQCVMGPIHDHIFSLLERLECDGTFNQSKPLLSLASKWEEVANSGNQFHSFDLSAATDRLPIQLQSDILSLITGNDQFGPLWAKVLVDRDWTFKRNSRTLKYTDEDQHIRYAVGQPMGALSSWGMLALTHHVLVRASALRVGLSDFRDYAVLGDDVVIANTMVAKSYHHLMTTVLGVDINLSKSLVSSHSLEFAKQLIVKGVNLSPIGPKNILVAMKSWRGFISLFVDMMNKGITISEESINTLFQGRVPGLHPKSIPLVKWSILGPFGLIPSSDGLTSSMRLVNALSGVRINSLLYSIDRVLFQERQNSYFENANKLSKIYCKLISYNFLDELPEGCNPLYVEHIRQLIIDQYAQELADFSDNVNYPKFQLIFDGPLIMTNHYVEGWMERVIKHITKKVTTNKVVPSIMDPFEQDKGLVLRKLPQGEVFFEKVRKYEQELDLERAVAWMQR